MTTPPPGQPYNPPPQGYGQPFPGQPPTTEHYGYAQQPYPPTPPQKRQRNVVGGIALGAAILGFVFSCIPGALIVGWLLLPIGFVLGLVGLFMNGRSKGTSIAAVIVSIVGTIVAAIVFIAVVGNAVDDAFGGDTDVTVSGQGSEPNADSSGGNAPTEDASADVGSRSNPASIGATIKSGDWEVVVNSFDPNATDAVLAANSFNSEPKAGKTYAVVNVTVTYTGDDSANANDVVIAYVSDQGNVYNSYDDAAVPPAPGLDGEVYNGATVTGNEALSIPANSAGLLRLRLGMFGDEVFVSTN